VLFLRNQEVSSSNFVFAGAYLVSSKKGLKRNDETRSVVVESGEGSSNFGLQGMGSSLLRGAIVSRRLRMFAAVVLPRAFVPMSLSKC
jgi:hypothetical protein